MTVIEFSVEGDPATKGSWRPIKGRDGKTFLKPDNDREAAWAERAAWAAKQAMRGRAPMSGPVRVELFFRVERAPTSKFEYPPQGDYDKFTRSLADAMSRIVYDDDRQVVQGLTEKIWTCPEAPIAGVLVRVTPVRRAGLTWEAA
jgi:Holliday junction resolvase RusA-like endonuclease